MISYLPCRNAMIQLPKDDAKRVKIGSLGHLVLLDDLRGNWKTGWKYGDKYII